VSPEVVPTLGGARPHVQIEGGPVTFEGIAGHYGATIYGSD
jgi:uncharacterized Zn-binding protein involved in type VI secretion